MQLNKSSRLDINVQHVCWLLVLTLYVCVHMLVIRVTTIVLFNDDPDIIISDFWKVLLQGARFDVATVLRLYFPIYLLSLVALFFPKVVSRWLFTIGFFGGALLAIGTSILSISNIAYMAFFNEPFGPFTIQSLAYERSAIIKSVWGGGSLWPYILAAVVSTPITIYALFSLHQWLSVSVKLQNIRRSSSFFFILTGFFIIVLLGRGTLGNFPLSHKHLIVSPSHTMNNAVPNGALSLYYATLEFIDSEHLLPASDAEGRDIFEQFYGRPAKAGELWPQLFVNTKPSRLLESAPPNVVLNLLESMAGEPLNASFNMGIDLAGELGRHLKEDIWLKSFLPEHNDTQSTLIRLLGNIDHFNVSQSKYKNVALQSAAAKVFQKAGYKTVFVFTGYEGIKYRSKYFLNQGFDEFVGAHQLSEKYPTMQNNVWGGEDAYMFKYVDELLQSRDKNSPPLFIVTLTTTNHPPYKVPNSYTDYTNSNINSLAEKIGTLPLSSLITYKYANEHLGRLITSVKDSELALNTIVLATGDHGVRGLPGFKGSALRNVSVPLYMYIPPIYKPENPIDLNVIASHKDIFPTLYNLALSDTAYPNLGRNLFARIGSQEEHNFAVSGQYLVKRSSVMNKSKPVSFYSLKASNGLTLSEGVLDMEPELFHSPLAYQRMVNWITRKQLKETLE